MGLWDKLKGEIVDIIYFKDDSNGEVISHRFERYNDEIKNGAMLTVDQSQIAVLVNEGAIADIFYNVPGGAIPLETKNVPILATLKGWKHGFNSPFKAFVYFLTAGDITGLKWGTPSPVNLVKKGFGPVKYTANGTFVVTIDTSKDAEGKMMGVRRFMQNIVKTDGEFTKTELKPILREQLGNYLENALRTALTKTASEEPYDITVDRKVTSDIITEELAPIFSEWGLILKRFNLDVCDPDETSQKRADKMGDSLANQFDNQTLGINNEMLKFQNATNNKNIDNPNANNSNTSSSGGMMGNMMEAGIGMGMMGMMMNQMGQINQNANNQNQNNQNNTPPPPPPGVSFHVSKNGQQAGPFSLEQLAQFVQAGELTPDTLVWKQGMSGWLAASTQPELANLFNAVPPPPPPPAG